MPQNIFKIYDDKTNFWQWDTRQKLIVLDERITEVHFSNRDMSHSITKQVYEKDGMRLCNIPDIILQLPRNIIAYACINGSTIKSVKFAVVRRPIPDGYVMDQTDEIDEITQRLELLEAMLKDIKDGSKEFEKFNSVTEAEQWAAAERVSGIIVAIYVDSKWIAHMIEDNYKVTPICDCNGHMVEVEILDGGDADGFDPNVEILQYWDGGGAAGL